MVIAINLSKCPFLDFEFSIINLRVFFVNKEREQIREARERILRVSILFLLKSLHMYFLCRQVGTGCS